MSTDPIKKCPECMGLGYFHCECWPGDCICGVGDRDCENCRGEGWIDTIYDDWQDDLAPREDADFMKAPAAVASRRARSGSRNSAVL